MNSSVERCNWIPFEQPPEEMEVTAKIRYNHPGTPRHRPADRQTAEADCQIEHPATRHHARPGLRFLRR